jgi:hypothetical protein
MWLCVSVCMRAQACMCMCMFVHVQSQVEPTVISWEGQGDTHFQLSFSYTGTRR